MTQKAEIPIGDEELDALMAELEAETAGAIPPPPVKATPAPEPEPAPAPVVVAVKPEPVPAPEPIVIPKQQPMPAPPKNAPELAPAPPVVVVVKVAEPASAVPEPTPAPAPAPEADPAPAARKPIALDFHIDVGKFREETAVSDTRLDQCMIEQNSLRAYYGEQAARSEAQASRIKLRFEVVEATLYDKHRKALALAAEKVTEKTIETAVKLDPAWSRARNLLIEADTIAAINKSLVESLKDRKDMIVQLGADRREEGKGQVRTMMQDQAHNDIKLRAQDAARR